MTTLLIDGDPVAYQAACAHEQSIDWDEDKAPTRSVDTEGAYETCDRIIQDLKRDLGVKDVIVCLSCATVDGWRRTVLPTYKANRNGVIPPLALADCKTHLAAKWRSYARPTLEADDILGILATHPRIVPGDKIIVSIDKDLAQVPGRLFNPRHGKMVKITREAADRLHMMQTLTGDAVDGYAGIRGVGPKKATKILDEATGTPWEAVRDAYLAAGLNEFDALQQARVARICRAVDYDFNTKKVRLWCPPMSTQPTPTAAAPTAKSPKHSSKE